jgi:hypothetical protein
VSSPRATRFPARAATVLMAPPAPAFSADERRPAAQHDIAAVGGVGAEVLEPRGSVLEDGAAVAVALAPGSHLRCPTEQLCNELFKV